MRRLEKASVAFGVLFLLRRLGRGGVVVSFVWRRELSKTKAEYGCVVSGEEELKEESVESEGLSSDLSSGGKGRVVSST